MAPFLHRHATALAIVIAAACAGTGFGFNTFAAHSTDPSGYVSTSKMLLDGNLVRVEPLVKTFDWYGGGWNFSPLGTGRVSPRERSSPPTRWASPW